MTDLSFDQLRKSNRDRQAEWPGNDKADLAFRAVEVAGETGEVCEAVKKYLRTVRGIKGSTASLEDVSDEMADVVISLDLLANELGLSLGAVVARKFNKTSAKYGMSTLIPQHNDEEAA